MRYFQAQQFEMLQYVTKLLKDGKDELSSIVPALRTIIPGFIEKQDALNMIVFSNPSIVKEGTLKKKSIRDGLMNTVMELSGVLKAHHFQNKDMSKHRKSSASGADAVPAYIMHNYSDLNRSTANELHRISQQVINAVKKIKFPEHYGITSGDIKDAETYLKEFTANKEGPKQRRSEVASRNRQLELGMKESILILKNTIDPLVRIATKDNPKLQFKYKNFRKVLPKGQGRPSDKEVSYRKSRKRKPPENNPGDSES